MKYLLSLLLLLPSLSYAIDCTYSKVLAIQAQTEDVLILLEWNTSEGPKSVWKKVGAYSKPYTSPYQAIAQQALATDTSVLLRFPAGNDCGSSNYGNPPTAFRLYN